MFFQQLHFKVQPHIIKRPPTKKKHTHTSWYLLSNKKNTGTFSRLSHGSASLASLASSAPLASLALFRMDASRLDCGFLFKDGSNEEEPMRLGYDARPIKMVRAQGPTWNFACFWGGELRTGNWGGQRVSFKNRGRFKVTTWGLAKHHSLPLWHPPLRHQKKSSGSSHYAHLFDKHPVIQVTQVLPKFLSKAVSAAEKWFQDTKWTSTIVIDGVMGPL